MCTRIPTEYFNIRDLSEAISSSFILAKRFHSKKQTLVYEICHLRMKSKVYKPLKRKLLLYYTVQGDSNF